MRPGGDVHPRLRRRVRPRRALAQSAGRRRPGVVLEPLTADEYEKAMNLLAQFFNIVITDSGTGISHPTMGPTLRMADSLVVIGSATIDGASRAGHTLVWLDSHGSEPRRATRSSSCPATDPARTSTSAGSSVTSPPVCAPWSPSLPIRTSPPVAVSSSGGYGWRPAMRTRPSPRTSPTSSPTDRTDDHRARSPPGGTAIDPPPDGPDQSRMLWSGPSSIRSWRLYSAHHAPVVGRRLGSAREAVSSVDVDVAHSRSIKLMRALVRDPKQLPDVPHADV